MGSTALDLWRKLLNKIQKTLLEGYTLRKTVREKEGIININYNFYV